MKRKTYFSLFLFMLLVAGCEIIVLKPPVPLAPLFLLEEINSTSAAFVWENTDEYAVNNVLYFRRDADTEWVSIKNLNDYKIDTAGPGPGRNRMILPGLEADTPYWFYMTALNLNKEESDPCGEIFLRTLLRTPVIRQLQALNDHTVLLEFNPVPGADTYAVFSSENEAVTGRRILDTEETSITLEVTADHYLFYRVQAIGSYENNSTLSGAKSVVTKLIIPEFTYNDDGFVESDENTADSVTLYWRGVRLADYYEIIYHTVDGAAGDLTAWKSVTTNATNCTITGLYDNTRYYFRIRALNATGNESLFSDAVTSTTRIRKPSLFQAKTKSSEIILLEWENLGEGIAYFLDYSATQSMSDPVSFGPLHVNQLLLTGLQESTKYYLRLSASGLSGKMSEYAFFDCVTLFSSDIIIIFDNPRPSDPVLTGNPGIISQVKKESYIVTAETAGWDRNSYEWYLNGIKQNTTGNSFAVDYKLEIGPYVLSFLATQSSVPFCYSTYFKVVN